MDRIIKYWPCILTIIVIICSILAFKVNGADSSVVMGMSLFYFYILMPFCALIVSFWYGIKLKDIRKWLIVPVFGMIEVLLIMVSSGDWDLPYYWSMCIWTVIPAALGLGIGTVVGKRKQYK